MPLKYSVIEIFTNEEARFDRKQVQEAVVEHVRGLKIAARCIVTRGVQGCYESGEIVSKKILDLSYNMPIKIEVVLPFPELETVLPEIEAIVTEGIIGIRHMDIHVHTASRHLFPRHLKVKDIMTFSPQTITPDTPIKEVAKTLLSSRFTGIPVVDYNKNPVGIVTQGDLIYRGQLPMRLGLLSVCDPETLSDSLEFLPEKPVEKIMSKPPVCIGEEQFATEAVELMISKNLKRLPVLNQDGVITGVLSRIDIFRTVMRESPDWEDFKCRQIRVKNLNTVSDIMRKDVQVVGPEASVEEVIRIIDSNDIQRVAVVDNDGFFMGLILDRDLLTAFSEKTCGIWSFFKSKLPSRDKEKQRQEVLQCVQSATAADVMNTDAVTVKEDTPLQTALELMTQKFLKQLPVIDAQGKFKGMISRDSLLKTAAAQ